VSTTPSAQIGVTGLAVMGRNLARNLARRVAEMFPKAAHLNVIRSWADNYEGGQDTALRAIEAVRVAMTQLRATIKNPVW